MRRQTAVASSSLGKPMAVGLQIIFLTILSMTLSLVDQRIFRKMCHSTLVSPPAVLPQDVLSIILGSCLIAFSVQQH